MFNFLHQLEHMLHINNGYVHSEIESGKHKICFKCGKCGKLQDCFEICANCMNPIDRKIDNADEKLQQGLTLLQGENIHRAIKRRLFRSIDLCNWCYSCLRVYRDYKVNSPQKERK